MEAITFDFYETLVFHREGRGRGHVLMDFLDDQRLPHAAWEHGVLYDIFDGMHTRYSPAPSSAERADQQREVAQRAFGRLEVPGGPDAVARHASALWQILGPASFGVYADVPDALRPLRAEGIPLALVSNWQCGLAQFCRELGLADYFDHIICSAELGIVKPDPAIFVEACARLGVPPEHVVHVGDSLVDDYNGAENAGLGAVLIARAAGPEPDVTRWVAGLAELPRVLSR